VSNHPQEANLYQNAVRILESGPNTIEDINTMRAGVFSSPETWSKFMVHSAERLDAGDSDYELKHAIGLAVAGRYEKAEEELEKYEKLPVVGCLLTRIYLETGREGRAVALMRKVHERVPEVPEYHALLCQALEAAGDLDGFKRELELLEERHPKNKETFFLKGLSLEREGEYEPAKRLYHKTLEIDPAHSLSLFRLGFRSDFESDDDAAIDFYTRSINSGVPNMAAVMNLGILYEDREEYEKAVQCFQMVKSIYPDNTRAQRYLEDALASLEMYYDEEKERKEDKHSQILKIPVSDFELSVRSRNCLAKMNIQSLGDLIKRTEAELLAFKNFGETSLMEIKEILSMKGLRLGMIGSDSDELPKIPDPSEPEGIDEAILSKSIDELDLSVRSRNCLAALKITTLGQLAATTEQTLMNQKNFGQTSLNEIRKKLADFSLSLGV
jgi:DNA-directed RNA polymerase subunit alpha